jgi:hypothetical protein
MIYATSADIITGPTEISKGPKAGKTEVTCFFSLPNGKNAAMGKKSQVYRPASGEEAVIILRAKQPQSKTTKGEESL